MPMSVTLPITDADAARIVPHLVIAFIGMQFGTMRSWFENDLDEQGQSRPVNDAEKRAIMIEAIEWVAKYALPVDIGQKLLDDKERLADDLLGSGMLVN